MPDITTQLDSYQDHLDALYPPVTAEDIYDLDSGTALAPLRTRRLVSRAFAFGTAFALIIGLGTVAYLVLTPEGVGTVDDVLPTIVSSIPPVTTVPAPAVTTPVGPSTTLPTTTATTESHLGLPTRFAPLEIYPPEGLNLMVVGVAHDGEVNVRQGPGLTPVITTLGPMERIHSAGEGRELATTTWWKVDVDGTVGWVNASYLASWVTARMDLTSYVVGKYDDSPTAATMTELGRMVAETLASEDYPSRVAMVIAPPVGNPSQATFDVVSDDPLGLRVAHKDLDGQTGWRLTVIGTPENGSFRLESVEGNPLLHACACWLP